VIYGWKLEYPGNTKHCVSTPNMSPSVYWHLPELARHS
jgi:hypothetical protein